MIYTPRTHNYYYHHEEPILVNQVSIREPEKTYMFVNFEPDGRWFNNSELRYMPHSMTARFQSQLTFRIRNRDYLSFLPNDIILVESGKTSMYYKYIEEHESGNAKWFKNLDTNEVELFENTYPFRLFHVSPVLA